MHFSNITVLIAEDDFAVRELWEQVCTGIGLRTITASTIKEGLEHVDKANILVVDIMLADGEASLLVSSWVERNGGPMLCVSGAISADDVRDYILRGADNAFQKTEFTTELLRTLIVKYSKGIIDRLRIDKLEKKVTLQQRAIAGLAIFAVGKELWQFLAPLIL